MQALFKDLPKGIYTVKYTTPEGYEFSAKSAPGARGPLVANGSQIRVYGENFAAQQFYAYFTEIPQPTTASYNVTVTVDGKTQAVTEELLNKLGFKLVNKEDGKEIAPTAAKGNTVSFADFEAGSYKLSYTLPDGYEIVKQVNIASDYKEFSAPETAEEASLDLHVIDKKMDKPVATTAAPAKKLAQTGVNTVMAAVQSYSPLQALLVCVFLYVLKNDNILGAILN